MWKRDKTSLIVRMITIQRFCERNPHANCIQSGNSNRMQCTWGCASVWVLHSMPFVWFLHFGRWLLMLLLVIVALLLFLSFIIARYRPNMQCLWHAIYLSNSDNICCRCDTKSRMCHCFWVIICGVSYRIRVRATSTSTSTASIYIIEKWCGIGIAIVLSTFYVLLVLLLLPMLLYVYVDYD